MKVLITATNNTLDSSLDARFGRSSWFAVKNTDTGSMEFIENSQNLNAMQGAGIQSGQKAIRLGVDAVVTGHVGPKAFKVLNSAGIKIYQADQLTIEQVITRFEQGSLSLMNSADKPGHW